MKLNKLIVMGLVAAVMVTGCASTNTTSTSASTTSEDTTIATTESATTEATETTTTEATDVSETEETATEATDTTEVEDADAETETEDEFDMLGDDALTALQNGDDEAALTYLKTAAYLGDATVAGQVGELYQNAYFGYKLSSGCDYDEAKIWDQIAIDMGCARGYTNMGILYYNGWGVDQDYDTAIEYFKDATDAGDEKGPRWLGITYEEQDDYTDAAYYFNIAAENGDTTGKAYLAELYRLGEGVDQDYDKALELYEETVDAVDADGDPVTGVAEAAYGYGQMYENGEGVDKDLDKAKEIYEKGAAWGNEDCEDALAALEDNE